MKKTLKILLIICIVAILVQGTRLLRKFHHANRLKINVKRFRLINISSEISSSIILEVGNFSKSTFKINQVSIEVFTKSGEILARPKAPLSKPFKLKPNQNNELPIDFQISTPVVLSELKRMGGITSVLSNFLTSGKYGLELQLRGFIVAQNIKIDINQTINV